MQMPERKLPARLSDGLALRDNEIKRREHPRAIRAGFAMQQHGILRVPEEIGCRQQGLA